MKLAKISLAAAVALGALSTASFAQPLEEAIKGVDVSGYLRYRYDDDRYENLEFVKGKSLTGSAKKVGAGHKYRALANFKTPVMNNVAMNVGVLYINEKATTNMGGSMHRPPNSLPSSVDTGAGLGAGSDGQFGVNTFFATITPDNTKTTIMVGKQLADTPVTSAGDFDRGTGILAVNSDVPNWTFVAGAFDTYAISDKFGYGNDGSFSEAMYLAAAIAKYGNFGAQAWFFSSPDIVDSLYYLNATYKMNVDKVALGFKGEYVASKLATDAKQAYAGWASNNNLYKLEADVALKPVKWTLGYLGNSEDNYLVALDDSAKIITTGTMGMIWWMNKATGVSIGAFKNGGVMKNEKDELSVLYTNLAWDALSNVKLALTYVKGEAEKTDASKKKVKREFQEITPMVSYNHSKNLSLSAFYAMLETEKTGMKDDEKRNRFRFQALYRF